MKTGTTGGGDESLITAQRLCVTEMMDAHPEQFRAPLHGGGSNWTDLIRSGRVPEQSDALVLEKAINMLCSFYNSVQHVVEDAFPVVQDTTEKASSFADFEPDAAALNAAKNAFGEDEAAVAFAKSVAIYKSLQLSGDATGNELLEHLHVLIDEVPGDGALIEDMKTATKKLSILQFEGLVKVQQEKSE